MSKKYFIRAANIVRLSRLTHKELVVVVGVLCAVFRAANPRFSTYRFEEACGLYKEDPAEQLEEAGYAVTEA